MKFTSLVTAILAAFFATFAMSVAIPAPEESSSRVCGTLNSTVTYGDHGELSERRDVYLFWEHGCHTIQGEPYHFVVYAGCFCNFYT